MSVLIEERHAGEYLISEGNGLISREQVVLASGNKLVAGAVLGQKTETSAVVADAGNTGNGTSSAATLGTEAINGTYTLTCITAAANAGIFSVATPGGALLSNLTVGVAYVSSHINLTISDGSTDFAEGDIFTIDVIIGEYAEFNPGASDGTQTAVAILWDGKDATSKELRCTITARDSVVAGEALTWKTGITEVQKRTAIAALKNKNIIVR